MILPQGNSSPYQPVGQSCPLRSVKEQVQLQCRWQAPSYTPHCLLVQVQDPVAGRRREPIQKGREIVADRADTRAVPVDEPRVQPVPAWTDDHVGGPEIAV